MICSRRVAVLLNTKARSEEERFKEIVYESIEADMQDAIKRVHDASEYFQSGSFEDQDTFLAAAPVTNTRRELTAIQKRNKALYKKTYFAHIEVVEGQNDHPEQYFLSDSEGLAEVLQINDPENECRIVPFIQDQERQFLEKLAECYRKKTGERFISKGFEYTPLLIRDVTVKNRSIIGDIVTYYSESGDDDSFCDYDELFSKRLEENRSAPGLHNIIATLQQQQFEIINADKNLSFVVQGCAGSGKSQCLIHRLFYLRSTLQDEGWDKVLLITPTQAFRNYSAELMHRYRLEGVSNTSITDLYISLLNAFDPRFRNRQYVFERTEEYLPDAYLHEVYAPANMRRIDASIREAIQNHVETACRLLELDMPSTADVDIEYVNALVAKLAEQIQRFDAVEQQLADDPEYREHRKAIDDLDKGLNALRKRQESLLDRRRQLEADSEKLVILKEALDAAETEAKEWSDQVRGRRSAVQDALQGCIESMNRVSMSPSLLRLLANYVELRKEAIDVTAPWGKQAQYDLEYLNLLNDICEECRQELMKHTKKASASAWLRNHNRMLQTNADNLTAIQNEIANAEQSLEAHSRWLQDHDVEEARKHRRAHRAELERARYYLSRIESSIFEQEVWNELADAKKENGIDTLQIVEGKDGHQRQNRILYKFDLLFYLKIYHALHKNRILPEYRMICIDEGQDLHRADYDLLRSLYPKAVLNIFGDVAQALHVECGISNWTEETGVEHVFRLDSNYRNNAAIVDFCNRNFGSSMGYCGSISNYPEPAVVGTNAFRRKLSTGDATVIVKNRETFNEMCDVMGIDSESICYVDTKVDLIDPNRISCYSIFAAKGLEFSSVMVYADGMTLNQKMVACTRAMNELVYCEA